MKNLEPWEAVIGLETHVQLNTKSKIFTSASTAFGDEPNTHVDPVVCGLPGTLPVLNETVLEYAVKTSLALNLNVAEHCKFDRKQYFYPDLPKNYQISQFDEPLAENGWLEVEIAENEFIFFISTLVPKGSFGPFLTDIFTSHLNEPSCIFPSETPRYLTVLLISEAYSDASLPVLISGLLTISQSAKPARL